jgi:hypothetical protein
VPGRVESPVANHRRGAPPAPVRSAPGHAHPHPMTMDNQIEIPQSFIRLYMRPGRPYPAAPHGVILVRYEQCEDMAVTLVEHAQAQAATAGLAERDILRRCQRGLAADAAGFSAPEARWVVCRLAELLEWQAPEDDIGEQAAGDGPPA